MTNSSNSSTPPPPALKANKAAWALMAASLLGLADAAYLTANHYLGTQVSCSVTHGCEQVLASDYATIQGVPISLVGFFYYMAVFLAAYYYRMTGDKRFESAYTGIVSVALAVTAYLVYLQLGVIGAICQYCMVSAGLTVVMGLIIAVDRFPFRKAEGKLTPPDVR